jgi:hypothetical protein
VIPEFGWNFDYTRLLWSGNARPDSHTTRTATFAGITAAQRRIPRTPAPGLFGAPIDMARVRGAAGDLPPAPAPVPAPRVARRVVPRAQAGNATGSGSGDRQTIPPVVGSYLGLLLAQLHDLATLAAVRIGQPTL